jgi:DNA polymerase-3 subunit epsilon
MASPLLRNVPAESTRGQAALSSAEDHPPFVAIDFETADRGSDSACAVGLVRVEKLCIVQRRVCLLRPPRRPVPPNRRFLFTYVHGITWDDVAGAPTFAEAWPRLTGMLKGAKFLAAHNAAFDRGVLSACCRAAGLPPHDLPFACTVDVARQVWNIRPTNLPNVCARLGLPLKHHDPLSDAEACARILIAAARSFQGGR